LTDLCELLRRRPAQLVVGPLQPLVRYDAVRPEHQEEHKRRAADGFAPGERRIDRTMPTVEVNGQHAEYCDDERHDERNHPVGHLLAARPPGANLAAGFLVKSLTF